MSIKNYPSNPFTQIIAREVKKSIKIILISKRAFQIKKAASTTNLFNKLRKSFEEWKNLQIYMEKACKEIQFPDICYTCP